MEKIERSCYVEGDVVRVVNPIPDRAIYKGKIGMVLRARVDNLKRINYTVLDSEDRKEIEYLCEELELLQANDG